MEVKGTLKEIVWALGYLNDSYIFFSMLKDQSKCNSFFSLK